MRRVRTKKQKVNTIDMRVLRQFTLTAGIAAATMLAQPLMAQSSQVTSAWNYLRYNEYTKARDAINKAIVNEKTMNDAKTWLYRGKAYKGIAEDEKLAQAEPDAVLEAYRSFKKAVDLDAEKSYDNDLKVELFALSFDLYNYGSDAYNQGEKDSTKYAKAYEAFMAFSEAENLMGEKYRGMLHQQLKDNKIDPLSVQQLIGSSAQLSGNSAKAIEYYTKLADAGYKAPGVYVALASLYRAKKDTAAALSILDKGLTVADEKRDLLNGKLDIYNKKKDYDKVIETGKLAIDAAPDDKQNVVVYLAMGNAYYGKQMPKEAEELYAKALAADPEGFDANYSVGIALYEQGRVKYLASLDEKSDAKAKKLVEEYTALFTKAIPYLEKSLSISVDDERTKRQAIEIVAEMYSQIGNYAKAKEYRDKLKQ
jgi:Tfp pilus assembly protein PilF